jgi:hypothetical protein
MPQILHLALHSALQRREADSCQVLLIVFPDGLLPLLLGDFRDLKSRLAIDTLGGPTQMLHPLELFEPPPLF